MKQTISAVIPTRNRPDDLKNAVASILSQKRLPQELIVVDQSEGQESVDLIKPMFTDQTRINLVYVHDTRVSGLVEAKQVASKISELDIVCFLEDDVVLEDSYIENIELGFHNNEKMLGCSGIITNQPYQSNLYRFMHGLFFRGILKDPRVQIFGQRDDGNGPYELVNCDVLSGGLSAWRREVLQTVPFDVANGFFMFEDIEYSTRVVKAYGHRLYVNRNARLEHHSAPLNRDPHGYRQRRKLKEAVLFYKKRRDWPGAKSGLSLCMIWWLAEASYRSLAGRSFSPFAGYWRGVMDGISIKLTG